jgi:hypothetical protein
LVRTELTKFVYTYIGVPHGCVWGNLVHEWDRLLIRIVCMSVREMVGYS